MAEEYTGIRFTAHKNCWKRNWKVNVELIDIAQGDVSLLIQNFELLKHLCW